MNKFIRDLVTATNPDFIMSWILMNERLWLFNLPIYFLLSGLLKWGKGRSSGFFLFFSKRERFGGMNANAIVST